jgi:hypothetical protein
MYPPIYKTRLAEGLVLFFISSNAELTKLQKLKVTLRPLRETPQDDQDSE